MATKTKGNKRRTPPTRYWVFRMNNGEEEVLHTKDDAEEYEVENRDIIEHVFKFSNKDSLAKHQADSKKHKAATISTPNKPNAVSPDSKLSPEDRIKLDRISAMIEQTRPTNKIELMYKTNSRATMAAVIIAWRNESGQHQWFCKPDVVAITMASYVTHVPEDIPFVQNALQRMSYMRQRDPEKGPDTVKTVLWTPPKGGKSREFDQHIAFTYVDIPFAELGSIEEEEQYLHDNLTTLGNAIKNIMQNALFLDAYKSTLKSDGMWDAMHKPKSGKSYLDYLAECKIKPMKCDNINTYAVLKDTKDVMTFLFNTRHSERKYKRESDEEETPTNQQDSQPPENMDNENDGEQTGNEDNANHDTDDEVEEDRVSTRSQTGK